MYTDLYKLYWNKSTYSVNILSVSFFKLTENLTLKFNNILSNSHRSFDSAEVRQY